MLGVSCMEAQVIIGGDDYAAGSLLSLNSTMRGGLQLSNVKLTIVTEIPLDFPGITQSNQNTDQTKSNFRGSVVFNTNSSFGSGKGIYAWDGEKWDYIGGGIGIPTGRVAYRNSIYGAITGWVDFMSYNLGATPMSIEQQMAYPNISQSSETFTEATATEFTKLFGDLYQWGRKTDGHEKVWSTTSSTRVPVDNFDNVGHGNFITGSDWLAGINNKLGRWGSVDPDTPQSTINSKGVNDPCPDGFRVPSLSDWQSILNGVGDKNGILGGTDNHNGVNRWKWIDSPNAGWLIYPPKPGVTIPSKDEDYEDTPTLFLPRVMYRATSGNFSTNGYGCYWSSTVYDANNQSYRLRISHGGNYNADHSVGSHRGSGFSVRCVAESRIPISGN
ncbi:MAG: fibrobacter succinogenes major paralogous domain-containing protein [Flavobacteriaceae bacterium]|jgi:uncharacterized protein (TIGR02145 family)|nr:fibrobacter succinogenes major paralogous domain-containing protein [Flavobacteriaceae bacterium]